MPATVKQLVAKHFEKPLRRDAEAREVAVELWAQGLREHDRPAWADVDLAIMELTAAGYLAQTQVEIQSDGSHVPMFNKA